MQTTTLVGLLIPEFRNQRISKMKLKLNLDFCALVRTQKKNKDPKSPTSYLNGNLHCCAPPSAVH